MIHVYDIGNDNYTGNGNAVLQPTKCRLRNIAGGNYDLTMTHPIDPEGKWKHLVPGAIIKAPVPREEIENAYAGYDADVYKTTAQAELRESASEPTAILYPEWNPNNPYQVGSKVRVSTWSHKNYQCTYYDETSGQIMVPPYNSSWWKPIADQTSGAPVLVTLPEGTDLYFVEDYDTNWYKMSTYYGVVGYIKKDKVQYDRHLTPSETQPRIITEQLFRIEKPTVDTKSRTVTLTAKHVSYDLAGILVQNVSIAQASPAMALGRIVEGFMMDYEGTIATDMQTADYGTYTGDIKGKNGIFALLDPDKGIVSTFNAAYKRDNWDLFVLTKETVDRGYRLKYRKNMLGVNWAQDASGLVTRVVPVAKDEKGENLYLPEKWVDSPLINTYPRIRMEQLPVKGQVGKDKGTGDGSTWTESDLLDEMRTKAAERFSVDEADKITVTVTVDFEQLGDAEEHQELKGMETVLLYDRVTVENEEIGLSVQLYVSEWEWDAIRKKITSLKLANTTDYKKGNVTGYNVQNKSIGSEKLTDEVTGEILQQAVDIMPEYAEPFDSQTHLNTKDRDGIVSKGSGQATKVWKTDAQGNPAWRDGDFILASEKGQPNGVATLDNAGKVPENQMPSYVDDIIEGYLYNGQFYRDSAHTKMITPETGKIYVDMTTGDNLEYRWSGSVYSQISKTSVNDSNPTLAWGQQSKIGDVAGISLHVTMPGNPDTWRPVVDALNSTDTDKSLSAKQGKVLNDNKLNKNVEGGNYQNRDAVKTALQELANGMSVGESKIVRMQQTGDSTDTFMTAYVWYMGLLTKEGTNSFTWLAHSIWRHVIHMTYTGDVWLEDKVLESSDLVNNLVTDDGQRPLTAAQGKVLNDNKVSISGDTMTGELLTSFKNAVAMGSRQIKAGNMQDILDEVRFSSGAMGSLDLSTSYGIVPSGWYNYFYAPHRSGGKNGAASLDNCLYGTLILSAMNHGAGTFVVQYNNGTISVKSVVCSNNANEPFSLKNQPLYEGLANANGTFNLTGGNMDNYTYIYVYVGSGGIRGSMYIPVSLFKIKPIYLPFIYGGTMREIDIQYVSGTQIKVTSNPGLNEVFEIFGCYIKLS